MKKYLISGALALIAGVYLTSCTHDDEGYSSLYEEKTQTFENVFKELYGEIDPNHDWGFKSLGSSYDDGSEASSTRALTRAEDANGNIWYQNWERPVNVTDAEKDVNGKVVQYFKQVRGDNNITITFDDYWVQQVYESNNTHTAVDGQNTYNASEKMNHLLCYDNSAADLYTHSYNFNGGDNTTTYKDEENGYTYVGTSLMKDMGTYTGTTAQFGYHNSVDSKNHFEYFIVAGEDIDESLAGYYYVGFDFCATGSNPNMQVERDYIYDDWIVRISPATSKTIVNPQGGGGETTTSKKFTADRHNILAIGRVFVEDLYKATREDLDFNDAVFDAIIWEVTHGTVTINDNGDDHFTRDNTIAAKDSVEICLLAAGGTIPLKIADDKFGDVHDRFAENNSEVSSVTMVNTRGNYSEAYGSYVNGVTPVYDKFDYTAELASKSGGTITLNDIKVTALWKSSDYTAAAVLNNGATAFTENGDTIHQDAPHMLCAPIGTRWATERKNIMEGYPGFRSYVNNANNTNVWNSNTDETSFYLYEDCPSPLKYGDKDPGFYYYDNIVPIVDNIVIWSGEQYIGKYTGDYWKDKVVKTGEIDTSNISSGDILRIEGYRNNDYAYIYCTDNWYWYAYVNQDFPKSGYIDVVLDETMISDLSHGIQISGRLFTLTKISIIKN